jgi:hypothetical protein
MNRKYEVLISDGIRIGNYEYPEDANIATVLKDHGFKPVGKMVGILTGGGVHIQVNGDDLEHTRLFQCPYTWVGDLQRVTIRLLADQKEQAG